MKQSPRCCGRRRSKRSGDKKQLVKKEIMVKIHPPSLHLEVVEELLATDDLFIQYFNAFLALPSFPEPLVFNKETGGFEVLNDAKRNLAKEIKSVVRTGRRQRNIYRPARNHSYSTIPLIPMEEPPLEEEKEIDTSFTVQTLNKEQGIEWIKAQRLPAFLTSDLYIEYRLARLLSQVEDVHREQRQAGSGVKEVVTMKIDYTPPPDKDALDDEEAEEEEDDTEVMMKDLYVCMGNASTTTTEAWLSQARSALDTSTTSSSVRPVPSLAPGRPSSARPTSARAGRRSKAGNVAFKLHEDVKEEGSHRVSGAHLLTAKEPVSRPSDIPCVVAENAPTGSVAYAIPRPGSPSSEESEDDDVKDDKSVLSEGSKDSVIDDAEDTAIVFHSIDELGAVIVGTVMKEAVAAATGEAHEAVLALPDIQHIFPSAKYHHFTKSTLDRVVCMMEEVVPHNALNQEAHVPSPLPSVKSKQSVKKDEDSDDSLLNSDDDYDDERDVFFRKNKRKKLFSLNTKKGFEQFKNFLEGGVGEKNWSLWVDIERAKLIEDEEELRKYIVELRERYDKKGSPLELSSESRRELELIEPTHWCLDVLKKAQVRMAEPLLLYWAPRFLIQQSSNVEPWKHYLYHHQRLISSQPQAHPNPPLAQKLPLRPKTCLPRCKPTQEAIVAPPKSLIADRCDSGQESDEESFPPTAPPTGMKRTYSVPDMFAVFKQNQPAAQETPIKTQPKRIRAASAQPLRKTPKELITAKLSVQSRKARPPTAPSSTRHRRGSTSLTSPVGDSWQIESCQGAGSRQSSQPADECLSRRSSASDVSVVSEFAGGRRMEGLLQALAAEKPAGGFLRKSIAVAENKLWARCLDFWQGLQLYHKVFYAQYLDPYNLQQRAKYLYSTYIVKGAPQSVGCIQNIADDIYRKLDPPFEELFDAAEEHVLTLLYDAWEHSLTCDIGHFGKVELVEVRRHLEAKSKYVITLQRRGIIKERPEEPDDPMEGYQDPVYDETLVERIPSEFVDFTLEKLVHNRMELEHFRQFLADHYASMDLMCWMDLEAFRRTPHTDEKRRDIRAKDIRVKYLNKKYFFGPNSPAGKEGQEKVMAVGGGWGKLLDDRPPTASLLEVQKYVRQRLEKKWLPLFLATESFAERQRPHSNMDDVVEDVIIQRKKKSQAIWKMLESKWVSSSKDILTFRKALGNPVTSLQFRKFVSIKGDNFENDVLFWQEVQRYKELCHLHSDRALIHQKTLAIISCFIDSPIPPSLQIDVTQEMADKILDRKMEATPYLFRESQLTVFRVLFSHWSDFCVYRSQLSEEKVLPTLERHRRKARAEEKRRLREQEEKKEKEEARRRQLGLPVDGEHEDDDDYDPFERGGHVGSDAEDEGDGERSGKESVSWSYSQYVKALDQEEVLNETDTSTFSSLMETKQPHVAVSPSHGSPSESGSEGDTSPDDSSPTRSKKHKKSKKEKTKVPTADTGSQTEMKTKKSVRVISPHGKQVHPDESSRSDSPSQKSPPFHPSPPPGEKPNNTRRRGGSAKNARM